MKFFIISDIHGFYDEMIEALNNAGFEPENENHWLISCGDNFDRGKQPQEVLSYLMSLERKTLVRGNHEDLIVDCCDRGYPEYHDSSNGTMKTIIQLGNMEKHNNFKLACSLAYTKLEPLLNQMVNYFETQNYVFVHSFIPYEYGRDWREASFSDWKRARWGDPFALCHKNLWKENKTIVFGHWHTSKEWSRVKGTSKHGQDAIYDIFYGNNYIGLDACTVLSKQVNVLVVEDDFI